MNPAKIEIAETMWALELQGAGMESLSVVERPTPRPGRGQALCRVEAASVSADDAELVRLGGRHRGLFGWDLGKWPIVLGHEGSLVVAAVGEGIGHRLRVGQRLVIAPDIPGPPRLDTDRYGKTLGDICRITVGFTIPGLLAQYVLFREDILAHPGNLVAVEATPSAIPHFGAALAWRLSSVVAAQALMVHVHREEADSERSYRAGILPGGVTVIVGGGPRGMFNACHALLRRPRHLIISELDQNRRHGCEWLGRLAEIEGTTLHVVAPADLAAAVRKVSGGRGTDDIVFAVSSSRAQEEAIALAGHGACVSFFASNPADDETVRICARDIHERSIAISGYSGSEPQDLRRAIDLQERGAIDLSPFVSAVGGIHAAPAAVQGVLEGRFSGKVVIYPHASGPELVAVEDWGPEAEERFLCDENQP